MKQNLFEVDATLLMACETLCKLALVTSLTSSPAAHSCPLCASHAGLFAGLCPLCCHSPSGLCRDYANRLGPAVPPQAAASLPVFSAAN